MRQRFSFLGRLYAALLFTFIICKPLFMLCNRSAMQGAGPGDYLAVVWHGLPLDLCISSYLTVVPLLLTLCTVWANFSLRRWLTAYYALVALTVSAIVVADISLYEFWKFKIDSNIFFYMQSPSEAMASVSAGYIALRVACIAALALLLTWLYRRVTPTAEQTQKSDRRILSTALLLLLAPLLFVTIRGGVGESTANVGVVYYSSRQELNHAAVNPVFSLLYSSMKAEDFASQFDLFAEEERERRYNALLGSLPQGERPTLLKSERPDVLLIIWESFARYFTEERPGGEEITPGFNRLAQEGVLFTNCYANSYRTDRGLVSLLSGHLSYPTTSIMKNSAKSQRLPSIAGQLRSAGYDTEILYGGDIDFTNMRGYLMGTGYNRARGYETFSLDERHSCSWGVSDHIAYRRLLERLTERGARGEGEAPLFSTLLTLSSHEPFDVPYHRLSEKENNAMAYSDSCLFDFVEQLKKSEVWDDLLVVITADHGFRNPKHPATWHPGNCGIALLWTGGAVKETARIETLMMQSDIAATLLSQLGIDSTPFSFSRNVLADDYRPFAYYTFNNGFAFIDSTGISVYDNDGNRSLMASPAQGDSARLQAGRAILQTSYDDLGAR